MSALPRATCGSSSSRRRTARGRGSWSTTTRCSTPPRRGSTSRSSSLAPSTSTPIGEVGDSDAYSATIDAVHTYRPDEIIISTYPATRSGWLRRDLIERVRDSTGLPVEHVVADPDTEGLPFDVTLAVANRTASGDELLDALKAKVDAEPEGRNRLFVIVVPQEGGGGQDARRARTRLKLVIDRLRAAGMFAAGMVGDPDPFTAITNALQYFRVDDIVISTFAETKSGWLRTDLIERVRRTTGKPVEHIVHDDVASSTA